MDAIYHQKADPRPWAQQCLALARGRRWDACATLARKWLASDPVNADAALYLLNALKAPATADAYRAALQEYASLESRLERGHEMAPALEVRQLAASIWDKLAEMTKPAVANVAQGQQVADRGRLERALGRMTTSRFASIPFATFLLTRDDVRRLGLQSGARWVVTGGIARSDGRYVLDLTMEKAAGGVEPRSLTLTSSSLIALADQAATNLAGLATTGRADRLVEVRRK